MHLYNILINGNDTFEFGHVTQQPSFEDAYNETILIVKSLSNVTIEQLRIVAIQELR